MNRIFFTTAVLVASAFASSAKAQSPRFYLSTDRVFPPGSDPKVKVEAKGVSSLQFRLYRVADPRSYFDAAKDLHRPALEIDKPALSTVDLLVKGARLGWAQMLMEGRRGFASQGRDALKSGLPNFYQQAIAGTYPMRVESLVPILQNHELLDIWTYDFEGRKSGWRYADLVVPTHAPGAYLVEAISGSEVAHTIVLVSEVALVTKQSSSQVLVWAVHPQTGKPQANVDVTVKVQGVQKGNAKTDAQGIARFDLANASHPVVYGQAGASFTLIDPTFFPANLPTPRGYVVSERPVYRASQEVMFKGVFREIQDEAYVIPQAANADVTFDVIDPNGKKYTSVKGKLSDRGSSDAKVLLPAEPAYGTWTVLASLGEERHAGEFKVMDFVKPEVRLRVRVGNSAIRTGQKVDGEIIGQYFFGAPYPDAEVKITVSKTRFYVPWYVDADYAWYYSDAEYRNTKRETVEETTCKLNAKGECSFSFTAAADSEDFTYVVEAAAKGPTGQTVVGSKRLSVTRGAFRLAIDQQSLVVEPGDDPKVVVRAIDYQGQPVKAQVQVRVSARQIGDDGKSETLEIMNKALDTGAEGAATISIATDKGGYYEIAASAKDGAGNEITQDGFVFVAAEGRAAPVLPGEIEIVTDRRSYFTGDTALVLLLTPAAQASVLFSVEGGNLYDAKIVNTKGGSTLVEVPVGAKQSPNFFLSASAVVGGQFFTKQRSVIVPPRERILQVEVAPDKPEGQPGDEVSITVSVTDYAGKPVADAEVAMSIVDEAIYAVSPEIAVPIEAFFHHRKRNDVRTNESMSFKFFGTGKGLGEKHARRQQPHRFQYGALKPQEDDRKVFKDTAAWFPSLITDAEGKVAAKFKLPDNLTAWRATARVADRKTAVGSGKGTVRCKKPLIVRLALPDRLVEGDKSEGAIVIQNLSGQESSFDVSFSLSAGQGSTASVTIDRGAIASKAVVGPNKTKRLPFTYSVSGSGTLVARARASGGGLKDGLEISIPVAPWSSESRTHGVAVTDEAAPSARLQLQLPEGVDLASAQVELSVMRSSADAINRVLPYLISYPYGCTEQTMSRFMPLLVAREALTRLQLPAPVVDVDIDQAIQAGIARLASLQHSDGGWGWWHDGGSDLWMTSWVVDGLVEAKRLGAEVDPALIDGGVTRLERHLKRPKRQGKERIAYALAALARANKPKGRMIDRMVDQAAAGKLSPAAMAHIVRAARATKNEALTTSAVDALTSAKQMLPGRQATFWGAGEVSAPHDLNVESTALAILALAEGTPDAELLTNAEIWLVSQFDGTSFGSTRASALAVRALAATLTNQGTGAAKVSISINGAAAAQHSFGAQIGKPFVAKPTLSLEKGSLRVDVNQEGPGRHFYSVAVTAQQRVKAFKSASAGQLRIARRYHTLEGSPGSYKMGARQTRFTPGQPVLVRLELDSPRKLDHVLVEDFRSTSLSPIQRDGSQRIRNVRLKPRGVRREHRNDRTTFFINRVPRGKSTYFYLARATASGDYRVLPSRAEAMYMPTQFSARSESMQIAVRSGSQ